MQIYLLNKLSRLFPRLKVILWKQWYQFLARSYKRKDWKFMNYGYAPLDHQTEIVNLNKTDEDNRFCIQLYHHVTYAVGLKDLNVLEVGSGRGGGADYIKRYMQPEKMVGVDFSKNAIEFCKQNYVVDGLSFVVGNAESLPFTDDSFDVVINVESSNCYASMDTFIGQVKRVLHKGGYFLFADPRSKDSINVLRKTLFNSGLTLVKETDITLNVIEAMKLDNERKTALIKNTIHKPLVKLFLEYAGTIGSEIYNKFKSREYIYLSFVLQK